MIFEYFRHPATRDLTISLVITDAELEHLKFTGFDQALFKECEKNISVADKLLATAAVVRRIEEEYGKNNG